MLCTLYMYIIYIHIYEWSCLTCAFINSKDIPISQRQYRFWHCTMWISADFGMRKMGNLIVCYLISEIFGVISRINSAQMTKLAGSLPPLLFGLLSSSIALRFIFRDGCFWKITKAFIWPLYNQNFRCEKYYWKWPCKNYSSYIDHKGDGN